MLSGLYKKISVITGLVLIIQSYSLFSATPDSLKRISPTAHHETFEGEYFPVSVEDMKKSPAYHYDGSSYFTTQVNISDEGENILGDAANEPSMAIDPTNPDKMVIGWRQFNTVQNNFRQAGYAYTLDGGDTWTFPGVIEPGVFRSDPVLDADADGNIYYNSLTVSGNNYYCDVFKMSPGSVDWDEGTYAQGGDKQWMTIDKTDNEGRGNIYASWTRGYSTCYPDFFTRSTNEGASYEDCVSVTGSPFWGTLTTGPDGTLYAAGYSDFGFIVVRSTHAQNAQMPVSWDSYSVVDLDGYITDRSGPNPDGLLGQTWIAADHSDGPYGGNLYLLCSVQRYNNFDPVDVMIARSTDGGVTWDDPVRVNQDESIYNWNWFGTMSVAPDGRIDVVWLDTRDASPGTYESSLYYSYSFDGGVSFSENERISESFDPHVGWPQQNKMGDYYHMISDIDYAHLAWASTLNGEQDVYYTRISPWFVGVDENNFDNQLQVNVFPNPSNGPVSIRYKLNEKSDVNIFIYDMFGKIVNERTYAGLEMGSQIEQFNNLNLSDGVYYVSLSADGKSTTKKLIVAD